MAFELFRLFGSVLIDNEKANDSIAKTEEKAEGLGNKLGNGIKTAGAWGLAIGAAAGAAGSAMFGVATKSAETTDRIDKMSQKLGMSKKGFQEWDYILGQNGISIDSLGGGMKTLTNMTDDLAKGSQAAKYSFGELGISLDDLKGKTQEEIFDLTVRKLMDVEDTTKRAALANDLLGRSGAELAPFLNQGSEGMDALRERAQELGLVLSDDAVNAGVVFGDTMDDLKRSFGAAATQIGVELMPMFQKMMDWVLAHMPEIKEFMSKAFEYIGQAVQVVWDIFANYLLPVFESIFYWVQDNWPTISAIITGAFDAIKLVWDEVLSPVLGFLWDAIKKVVDFVSENFPGFDETISKVFDNIGKAVETVVDIFVSVKNAIKDAWEWLGKWQERDEQSSFNAYGQDSYGGSYGSQVNGTGGTYGSAAPILNRNERREESGGGRSMNVNINVRSPYDVVNEIRILDKGLAAEVR